MFLLFVFVEILNSIIKMTFSVLTRRKTMIYVYIYIFENENISAYRIYFNTKQKRRKSFSFHNTLYSKTTMLFSTQPDE